LKITKILEKYLNSQLLDIKLGDINGDGKIEIVVSTRDGRILILSRDGKIIHELFVSEDKPIWNIDLYDITRDGKMEIISGGLDGLLKVFYSRKHKLELLWSHSFQDSISGFFLDDITDDLRSELIAYGLDKSLRVLNSQNGELIWGQLFEKGIGIVRAYDCDGDGQIELIGGGNDGTVRVFNGQNGVLKWFKKFSKNIRCISCFPNNQVIICGGDNKKIYFLDGVKGDIIKSYEMEEYVWESSAYLLEKNNYIALIYSYSFDFLDPNFDSSTMDYKSRLLCINNNLEIDWELTGFNIEDIKIIKIDFYYLILGTNDGRIIILSIKNGKIIKEINLNSTPNKIEIMDDEIYCATNDGKIFGFSF
jgi:WD40 repeat protein